MKTISATQAQKNFGDLLMEVSREPISIKKHNKEVAILISSYDFQQFIETSNKNKAEEKISNYLGKGKNSHRFSSTEDVESFISSNREVWEI